MKTVSRSISAASVMAAGSVMKEPSSGTSDSRKTNTGSVGSGISWARRRTLSAA